MKKLNISLNNFKKKDFNTILLIFILFVILLKNTDFFKNSYYIVNKDHDLRLQENAYDFCDQTGSGYVLKIKKKFKLKGIPQIKNFHTSPNQYWIFQNYSKFDKDKLIVLFNIDEKGSFRFDYSNYKILDSYKNDCLFLEKND